MSEEIKKENITEEKISQQQTNENTTPEKTETEAPEIKSEENKKNWAKFREEREKDRKARLEAERIAEQKRQEAEALKAAMEALVNKNVPAQNNASYDIYSNETEEQRIEKLVSQALEKERQKNQEEQRKRELQETPQRLNQTYHDFNRVCTTENLDYLEYHHPEVAKALSYMPEGFEKWSTIYNTVKKFVPYENKNEDAARIQKNALKPQAATPALTDTKPHGSPWKLTEERRKANWARMQKDMKSM